MLTARSYPGVVRYATYSANPIAKTGTIDDLVHNDALRRGHNAPRLASGWKVDRSAKVANEPFPLPDHKYVFQAMAVPIFTYRNGRGEGGDTGRYVGQSVQYEEILPRCEGKTSPLKWKHLTEEDRYTRRAWHIRNYQRADEVGRTDRWSEGKYGWSDYRNRMMWSLLFLTGFIYGTAPSYGKEMSDMKDVGMGGSILDKVPVFDQFIFWMKRLFTSDWAPGRHHMWGEAVTGANYLRDYEYFNQHHTTSPTSGKRNTGTIPTVPPTTFRENNELYYDGAEGPDKIGTYNVYNWKHGEESNNAAIVGNNADNKRRPFYPGNFLGVGAFT